MIELTKPVAEWGAVILEVVGICIIVLLALYALILGMISLFKKQERGPIFQQILLIRWQSN